MWLEVTGWGEQVAASREACQSRMPPLSRGPEHLLHPMPLPARTEGSQPRSHSGAHPCPQLGAPLPSERASTPLASTFEKYSLRSRLDSSPPVIAEAF